ncbi:MAG: ABC transporter permease [Thaumarchaeota archaeon]|nr:ABC transporter permease [Nitrososphaerota archaeon]
MESMRNMAVMIELEVRRLRHDWAELYGRAIQPLLWLGVFGPIMSTIRAIPTGGVPYIDFITPGVLLQSVTFVSIHYGINIVWERESGILKKLLVIPGPRYSIVIGRAMASGLRAIFQSLIILPVALLIGVRFVPNPLYFVLAIVVIFLISGGFASFSILIASFMKTRERFMGIGQSLSFPLLFTSNALYPLSIMPPPLQFIARLNPMSYVVNAVRGLTITGDISNLAVDLLAVGIFDVAMFVAASISFKRVIE